MLLWSNALALNINSPLWSTANNVAAGQIIRDLYLLDIETTGGILVWCRICCKKCPILGLRLFNLPRLREPNATPSFAAFTSWSPFFEKKYLKICRPHYTHWMKEELVRPSGRGSFRYSEIAGLLLVRSRGHYWCAVHTGIVRTTVRPLATKKTYETS